MRFLLRSAFWLTLAFLLIRPAGVDLQATAGALSSQALASGQQFIADQIGQAECASLQCVGGKALLTAALPRPAASVAPLQPDKLEAVQGATVAPIPRPRLHRAE